VNDETFAVLVQRYAEGELRTPDRAALLQEVQSDPARREQFARQVRLNLELHALLQPEDAEDAHLRASLIVSEDDDVRDRRVMASLEKKLDLRRSTRSMKIVRPPPPAPQFPMKIVAAAAIAVALAGALLMLFSGGESEPAPKAALRPVREMPVRPAPEAERPPESRDRELEAAEQKRRERARRMAEDRAAMEREPKEEPKPAEEPARTAPKRATTVTAMARLMSTTGTVNILAYGRKIPAQPGQDLLSGQGIETIGPLSWAALRFADGTRLELWADTRVSRLVEPVDSPQGKQAYVTEGTLLGAVAKQPPNKPFVLTTPQGEARVLGTVLSITVEPDGIGATRLEVGEGKVQFKETVHGNAIDVTTGLFTVASAGAEMKLKSIPPVVNARRKPTPPVAGLDAARVDAAVRKAVQYLKTAESPAMNGSPDSDELLLWTFIHAGVDPYDARYQQLLMKILDDRRENATYSVALRAMILEELNRNAYQGQLLRYAQVLVDNQCANGQWDYRVVTPIPDEPIELIPVDPSRGGGARQKFAVRKRREGPPTGDNSNSAYAAFGLRACHDAGIVIPEEVVDRARSAWVKQQQKDGGWGYGSWRGGHPSTSYGSLTACGVSSVAIYDHLKRLEWKKDPAVASGTAWLAKRFSLSENPGAAPEQGGLFIHYLNAVQRTGVLFGTETFGRQMWYPDPVKTLVSTQNEDGSWTAGWNTTWDTCFAVLFLRRAGYGLGD
jgi:ferric-dicitrate binding protein FerR (iron transport regulator)